MLSKIDSINKLSERFFARRSELQPPLVEEEPVRPAVSRELQLLEPSSQRCSTTMLGTIK
jgi:hypothetical protein